MIEFNDRQCEELSEPMMECVSGEDVLPSNDSETTADTYLSENDKSGGFVEFAYRHRGYRRSSSIL